MPALPTIALFRHGQTHWNRARRVQGRTDAASPLTLTGIDQARAYGVAMRALMGSNRDWPVIASPLARCAQTAGILCEIAGLDFGQVRFDPRLAEVDTGAFSGLAKPELDRSHPELMGKSGLESWFFRCPGGETFDDLAARLGDWLRGCESGEKLVVISHGVAGKVLRALYTGRAPETVLAEDSPQDAFFLLENGTATRVACAGAEGVIGLTP